MQEKRKFSVVLQFVGKLIVVFFIWGVGTLLARKGRGEKECGRFPFAATRVSPSLCSPVEKNLSTLGISKGESYNYGRSWPIVCVFLYTCSTYKFVRRSTSEVLTTSKKREISWGGWYQDRFFLQVCVFSKASLLFFLQELTMCGPLDCLVDSSPLPLKCHKYTKQTSESFTLLHS